MFDTFNILNFCDVIVMMEPVNQIEDLKKRENIDVHKIELRNKVQEDDLVNLRKKSKNSLIYVKYDSKEVLNNLFKILREKHG